MKATEAREQAEDYGKALSMLGIKEAVCAASENGAKGIVVRELSEAVIDELSELGYRTLTMHGNTTILW